MHRLLLCSSSHQAELRRHTGPLPFLRRFSYEDIKRATGGFCSVIARHSHGSVYKAQFQDGLVAIVRQAKFYEEKDDFFGEVQLLGRLHHSHLVALVGFSDGPKRFLVFEFTEYGSLKEHLSDPLRTPLTWRMRLQIAVGVAAALVGGQLRTFLYLYSVMHEYLHCFCEPPVNHVYVNSSTVLLDETYVAKLSDVSFLGYIESGPPTADVLHPRGRKEHQDVIFQFGVLILELITGQSSAKGGTDLVRWVQDPQCTNSVHQMLDPDIANSYDPRELKSLLTVARLCTKKGDKPFSVQQILRYLQGKVDPPIPHV